LKSYLITDPKFYPDFKLDLTNSIEKYQPNYICFRDKSSTKDAKTAIEIAKYYKIPIVVNQYIELVSLGFDGVHLTSNQLYLIDEFKNYITFASTHSIDEINNAKNSDFITFSPVFNSKGRTALGIGVLNDMCQIAKPNVFALGGITSENEVDQIKTSKAYGFASIRYFVIKKNEKN